VTKADNLKTALLLYDHLFLRDNPYFAAVLYAMLLSENAEKILKLKEKPALQVFLDKELRFTEDGLPKLVEAAGSALSQLLPPSYLRPFFAGIYPDTRKEGGNGILEVGAPALFEGVALCMTPSELLEKVSVGSFSRAPPLLLTPPPPDLVAKEKHLNCGHPPSREGLSGEASHQFFSGYHNFFRDCGED